MEEIETVKGLERGGSNSFGRSVSRSISRASWRMEEVFSVGHSKRNIQVEEEEEALKWAAIEKLPTYDRLRTSIMQSFLENEAHGNNLVHREIDVRKLDFSDRQMFIERVFKVTEEDNEKFLKKTRNRIDT